MEQKTQEPRLTTIDGQRAIYQPAPSFLPESFPVLLRVLRKTTVLTSLRFAGYRPDCGEGEHRLVAWLRGTYGIRDLLINRCLDCQMAEVRDISFDILPDLPRGRLALRRKSDLLGWYSGARPLGRVYL